MLSNACINHFILHTCIGVLFLNNSNKSLSVCEMLSLIKQYFVVQEAEKNAHVKKINYLNGI